MQKARARQGVGSNAQATGQPAARAYLLHTLSGSTLAALCRGSTSERSQPITDRPERARHSVVAQVRVEREPTERLEAVPV